ncbi:unnamed protein product [Rangifer tarandus platyrhynchus]|uniref:Uncharacterized protein n=1 Tax=Rangifer tarandus platyrhynchus TaxID=3082113 RepID=A0ABN9A1U3_RANTA|nr:unnamed protein product [Rangifer tarandus platyrhynchus]
MLGDTQQFPRSPVWRLHAAKRWLFWDAALAAFHKDDLERHLGRAGGLPGSRPPSPTSPRGCPPWGLPGGGGGGSLKTRPWSDVELGLNTSSVFTQGELGAPLPGLSMLPCEMGI